MGHGNPKLYMRWPINANARRINLNLKEVNRRTRDTMRRPELLVTQK